MGFDIRLPIGLMFAIIGTMLVVWGVISDPSIYTRSLGYNVNLVWGLVLLVFGVSLLFMVWRRGIKFEK